MMALSSSSYTGFNIRNKQASKSLKMISAVFPPLAQYKACGLSHCEHTCIPHHPWPIRVVSADAIKEVSLGKKKTPRMPLPHKHLLTQCLFFTVLVKILLARIHRQTETTRHSYRTIKIHFLWKLLPAGQTDSLKCMSPHTLTAEAAWSSLCTSGPTHFSLTVHSSLDVLLCISPTLPIHLLKDFRSTDRHTEDTLFIAYCLAG